MEERGADSPAGMGIRRERGNGYGGSKSRARRAPLCAKAVGSRLAHNDGNGCGAALLAKPPIVGQEESSHRAPIAAFGRNQSRQTADGSRQ